MKKTLLLLTLTFVGTLSTKAQIILEGISPVTIEGNYNFTYTSPDASAAWGYDLSTPGFSLQDTLIIVDDGTSADSLGCNVPVNNIAGKIAVVYRGSCEFGVKALTAEQAGAVAVIIVNNVSGDPVGMGAGASGSLVTIPVIMISKNDGALLRAQIDAGDVVMRLVNLTGVFPTNLGIYKDYVNIAKAYGTSALTASVANNYSVPLGASLFNRGNTISTDAVLDVKIDYEGTNIYTASSPAQSIIAGDTIDYFFPDFTQTTFPVGLYTISYVVHTNATDQYSKDDSLEFNFEITEEMYSLVPLDDNAMPIATSYTTSGDEDMTAFSPCIKYQNPKASNVVVEGIYFSAKLADVSLDQEEFQILAYEWGDEYNVNAPAFSDNFTSLTPFGETYFSIDGDLQETVVYAPFFKAIEMDDDVKYLFCIVPANIEMELGFNGTLDYSMNNATLAESVHPMLIIKDDVISYFSGFSGNQVLAASLKMANNTVSLFSNNQLEGKVYPNPTSELLTIEFSNAQQGTITATDVSGKVVLTHDNSFVNGEMTIDLKNLETGLYIFDVQLDNGSTSKFNVVKK